MIMTNKDDIVKEIANDIHSLFLSRNYKDDMEFLLILSSLIDELLSDNDIKKKFNDLIIQFEDSKIKLDIFSVIRNILVHFPIFKKWEEVYINYNIVTWNKPKYSKIVNFFEKYKGRKINYRIYKKYSGIVEDITEVELIVPDLNKGFYLSDFISYEDTIDIFHLIYYLLMEYDIDPNELLWFPSI